MEYCIAVNSDCETLIKIRMDMRKECDIGFYEKKSMPI